MADLHSETCAVNFLFATSKNRAASNKFQRALIPLQEVQGPNKCQISCGEMESLIRHIEHIHVRMYIKERAGSLPPHFAISLLFYVFSCCNQRNKKVNLGNDLYIHCQLLHHTFGLSLLNYFLG